MEVIAEHLSSHDPIGWGAPRDLAQKSNALRVVALVSSSWQFLEHPQPVPIQMVCPSIR
jgi:hypothetical protein